MTTRYTPGTAVKVLTRYEGNGRYAPDGFEGTMFVHRVLGNDLLVSRDPDASDWEVCIHRQRIDGDELASWRRDQH